MSFTPPAVAVAERWGEQPRSAACWQRQSISSTSEVWYTASKHGGSTSQRTPRLLPVQNRPVGIL